MTFQFVVSLLPWILIGCALFLVLWFVLDLKMRLIMLWYGLTIRYWLWRGRRELGWTDTYREFIKEDE
jgi:hypothetical protein